MTDHPDTLARYRLPLNRDRLMQAGSFILPALRYLPKNPVFMIGALALGVLAWRNRNKIARAAGPILHDARTKGQSLAHEAKGAAQALSAKAARLRRGDAGRSAVSDIY